MTQQTTKSTKEQIVQAKVDSYIATHPTFWMKDLNAHIYTTVNIGIHSMQQMVYSYIQKLVTNKKLSCIDRDGNTKKYMVI
jgi:hypothetical protein